ncbi:hypothetical protein FPOA_06378 [Fusarium poae]|uniref:Uncharacterized protein n=1 Tax=Fusarium poae TaxID=36050 RepID=A0A1B8AZC2_FUSPO|nr:hypothetical protein FPOA_06378 [Fusarium poae]
MRLPRDAYPFTSKAAAQILGRRLLRPRQDLGYHRWSNASFYGVGGCRPLRETLFRMRSETAVFLLERGANPDTTEDEARYSDRPGDTLVAALENILASQLLYAEPYTSDLQSTLLIRLACADKIEKMIRTAYIKYNPTAIHAAIILS